MIEDAAYSDYVNEHVSDQEDLNNVACLNKVTRQVPQATLLIVI